LYVGKF